MHRKPPLHRSSLLMAVVSIFLIVFNCDAEDVIWRVRPTSSATVNNHVVTNTSFGPGNNILANYALTNVFVDPDRCDDAQPGVINQITTWFEDDGISFGKTNGIARLNVFVVPAAEILPTFDDDPDFGIDVPVTYTQTMINGMDVVQVQANNLGNLQQPILIQTGIRYYIGLTPVFNKGEELFQGDNFANFSAKDLESASAVRTTAPPPGTDWEFAEDDASGNRLYATMEIRGFTTPNIYLSTQGFGEGALPGHEIVDLGTGETATVFVWVNENLAVDTALSLDVNLLTPSIAEFNVSESVASSYIRRRRACRYSLESG